MTRRNIFFLVAVLLLTISGFPGSRPGRLEAGAPSTFARLGYQVMELIYAQ